MILRRHAFRVGANKPPKYALATNDSWPAAYSPLRLATLLVACLLISPFPAHADIPWQKDYAAAARQAASSHKPLLVEFYATWCGPCKMMEETTFRNAALQKLMARCVCVRVDVDQSPAVAKQYGVSSIPRMIVLSGGKRVLDSLGYREAADLRSDLASALGGKIVNKTGGEDRPTEAPEITALRQQADTGKYAAWKAKNGPYAAKARLAVVEQLGAFDAEQRDSAATLLARLGDDGVDALVAALASPKLAVRAAAFDTLSKVLSTRYKAPVASLPRYDPWAATGERTRMAHEWAAWWQRNRGRPTPGA